MKKTILLSILIVIAILSCKKANVTDDTYSDNIEGVRIRYVVSVVDGSTASAKSETSIQNAVVCMVVNDSVYEIAVDKNGIAIFNNLFAGNALVQVKCEGYTTANLIVDLKALPDTVNIYDATNRRIVSNIISIFPTTGDNLANVSGKIYADLDFTNAGEEAVSTNLNIRAVVDPDDLYSFVDHSGSGRILDLSYEGFLVSTNSQSGAYSLSLPATTTGLNYIITSDDFEYQSIITSSETERHVYRLSPDTISVQTAGNYIRDLHFGVE